MSFKSTHQFQASCSNQAGGHGPHAAQGAGNLWVVGKLRIHKCEEQDDDQWHSQHARQGRHGAAETEIPVPNHEREIDHVGSRHDLRDRPLFDKLFTCEPAFFLDQLTLHYRQNTAKPLQRQEGERYKKVGEGLGLGTRVIGVC